MTKKPILNVLDKLIEKPLQMLCGSHRSSNNGHVGAQGGAHERDIFGLIADDLKRGPGDLGHCLKRSKKTRAHLTDQSLYGI